MKLISTALFCALLAGGALTACTEAKPPDAAQSLREMAAVEMSAVLQKTCKNCQIVAVDKSLTIIAPGMLPGFVANEMLKRAKTKDNLKRLGFVEISVSQSTGPDAKFFNYEIK